MKTSHPPKVRFTAEFLEFTLEDKNATCAAYVSGGLMVLVPME